MSFLPGFPLPRFRNDERRVLDGLDLSIPGDGESWAAFSRCGRFRYALGRRWSDADPLVACLHNPSCARHDLDDPTVRKAIGFAHRDGFGALVLINPFAFRATDPREMLEAVQRGEDVVGPLNLEVVERFVRGTAPLDLPLVAGWGPPKWKSLRTGIAQVRALSGRWQAWHVTKNGHPGHPLYLRGDAQLRTLGGAI